jgi:hypothetical protein
MKSFFLFITCFFVSVNFLYAGKIDDDFLKKINGTKWDLVAEKKYGKGGVKNANQLISETITFSDGSILFDLPDQNYACNYTLKNKYEFWLYCAEPDQYIYKIQTLNNRELVMEMWVKNRKGEFVKTKRLSFRIHL